MKKRRLWLVALSLVCLICLCFCLAACNDGNSGGNSSGGGDNNGDKQPVITALATPAVAIDGDGKATWSEVANASGYAFKLDDGGEQATQTREVQLADGQSVSVKAKGDGVRYSDSDWSTAQTYTATVVKPVKLGVPSVTVYSDGRATWVEVESASGYTYKINGGTAQTAAGREVQLTNGQSISVQAVGDGAAYLTGDYSAAKTYWAPAGEKLSVPTNLEVAIQGTDEGKVVLSWHAVKDADGYRYVVNDAEQNGVNVEDNSVTVDLCAIDASKLDTAWTFKVKAIGNSGDEIADDGDYSACRDSSDYCTQVEFSISNGDFYTEDEILEIINYYGAHLPVRDFMIAGTLATNANGTAAFENGFTLFGRDIPDLYLAIDGNLAGLDVNAMGTLAVKGEVKGLACSYVDFENIAENDSYTLVKDTLEAWDILKADSRIMGDLCLPVNLYGINILWAVEAGKDAFAVDDAGNVSVTCPAADAGDISVTLGAMLYVDDEHSCDDVLEFTFFVAHDARTPLTAPKININPKTGVATWTAIEHATGYRVTYYGFSVPGNYYSDYVSEEMIIAVDGNRSVQLKDTWWITVQAIGDSTTYGDSDIASKQYNYYPETVEPDGTPLEFDMTVLTQTGNLANPNYIFGLACHNSNVFVSASASRVELGNSDDNGAVMGTGFIKVGSSNNKGKITLNFNKKILGVVITARQWNKDQNDKLSVNGSAEQTASKNDWGIMNFNFTASKAATKVEIDTDNRVFIQRIVVYVQD